MKYYNVLDFSLAQVSKIERLQFTWMTFVLPHPPGVPLGLSVVGGMDQKDSRGRVLGIRIIQVCREHFEPCIDFLSDQARLHCRQGRSN